jgi:hypothetical protein
VADTTVIVVSKQIHKALQIESKRLKKLTGCPAPIRWIVNSALKEYFGRQSLRPKPKTGKPKLNQTEGYIKAIKEAGARQ